MTGRELFEYMVQQRAGRAHGSMAPIDNGEAHMKICDYDHPDKMEKAVFTVRTRAQRSTHVDLTDACREHVANALSMNCIAGNQVEVVRAD